MYPPDAGGARPPTFRAMADKLAGCGYAVLVPDVYYRDGDWAPFTMRRCSRTRPSAAACSR